MRRKVTIYVEKGQGSNNFACSMDDDVPGFGLAGYGPTARAAIEDMHVAYDEIKALRAEEGKDTPDLEYEYKFDVGSLFSYYDYLNMSGVAKKAGVNASLMRQYASGLHKPSERRRSQIEATLKDMAKEMASAELS